MNGKISRSVAAVVGVIAAFVVVSLLFGFTVVSTDEEAALTVEFDPAAYVADNWDAVQIAIREDAVPLADLLNEIEPGLDGSIATEELEPIVAALGSIATGDAHVYRVTGTGTVSDVDVESSKGSIGIVVDGYDGPINVRAWIGTRIPSDNSAVRDATGFIEFGDFRDQTEFGKVAKEINKKVVESLGDLDKENLAGKSVEFTGALAMRTANMPTLDVSELKIVPIEVIER
jgi:predicted lipoprotein